MQFLHVSIEVHSTSKLHSPCNDLYLTFLATKRLRYVPYPYNSIE